MFMASIYSLQLTVRQTIASLSKEPSKCVKSTKELQPLPKTNNRIACLNQKFTK